MGAMSSTGHRGLDVSCGSVGTESTGRKDSVRGRGQGHSGRPPGPENVELCSFYPTPEEETGDNPPQARAGQGADDSSVTLAALVGWGLGSSPRTPQRLAVPQTSLSCAPMAACV